MNRRRFFSLLLILAALGSLTACSLLPFHRHKEDPAATQAAAAHLKTNPQGLAAELKVSPDPIKLGEVRLLDVTLILRNFSKGPVHLNFPGGQTVEILIREPNNGKVVAQWSTDRTFNSEARYLLVNPQERLEFPEQISTRDLQPGKPYTVEAYFIGYEKDLKVTKAILPQP